jgi:hypothetical protein
MDMKNRRWIEVFSGGVLLSLAGVAAAADATANDVSAELAKLRAEVAELRGQQGQTWLNERRAEEVKALVREVLADADTRASLQDKSVTAGHNGKNFFLASEDGNFLLNIGGQIQARYIFNTRDTKNASSQDDTETGFQIRRAKLQFDGHIGTPKFEYKLVLAADRNTTQIDVEEAEIGYKVMDNLTVGGGRFKDPFLREDIVSSRRQLAVERSIVNEAFSTRYVEGIKADWKPLEELRVRASFNDGARSGQPGTSGNGNAGNDFDQDRTDYAVTGRVDFKALGDWSQGDDFSSWEGTPTSLILGAAVHYEKGESGENPANGSSSNSLFGQYDQFLTATADASFKIAGFSFYGAGIYQTIDTADGTSTGNLENWAAVGQVSYFVIPDKLEPFGRYEYIGADTAVSGESSQVHILTFGANYYFKKHAAKFTTDVVWAINPLTTGNTLGGVSGGQGLLADPGSDNDNQVALRAQFQLLF